ncbi:uncharacterized protein ighd isoform X1 [Carassius gibelio]|uniref:uncharacterized protein ighd isoform X1 n=1 Tax=Carassius gibelio TaxID=101364 RepID=UPI0022795FD7|nr:uncharacterized protein ighd isoform X1 [Carassius gibelio]
MSRKEGDRIVLECQLRDYFPEKITVNWFEGDNHVKGQIDKKFQNTDKGEKKYTFISQLSISAQYEGKNYSCKATHNSEEFKKEYNMCMANPLCKPSIQMKKSHLRDIIQENKVTVTCVVEAPDNTKVSWLTDSARKTATTEYRDQFNNTVSNLTLFRNDWLTLKTVVCTAKHPCFPEVKVEIQTANIKTDPVVVIRRRFVKSTQTDSPVLECVVNGLPSGEVCINFQANQIDISVLSCVDWAPSENIWSLTKQFPIPKEHQRNGKTFTCKVQRPFKSWTSKPTGNIFGDPTIQLAVVPSVGQSSSDQQKLLCSVTGFNPNIKWLSDSVVKPGRDLDLTMMEDGRVKVYSEISVPQQEWNQGITYTCEINNGLGERSAEKSTSICAAQSLCKPSIQMKKSHLRDIIQENKVTVSCVVEAPDNTKVSLLTDSVRQTATTEYRDQFNNTVSNLTLFRNDWLTLKTVVCTAKHPCFPEVKVEIQTADIKTDPVVVIRRRFVKSTQTDSPVLECVVNGLPSGEVCINFQANQIDISVLSCVDWAPSENIWSLTKQFPIPKEHQRNGKTFTCKVQRPFKSWTSKPTGNIFGNATIQLAVVPSVGQSSSDQQKLLCSVTGFNPNIKWLSDSVVKPGRDLDLTMMEDGRVKVYSEISVPQQEWNQGITYTCEINNGLGARIAEKSTSICAAQSLSKPSIQMKKSHLRDIIQENKVTVTCFVEAPDNTKVSWLTDSARKTATTEYRDQFNNTVSNLTLSRNDWLTLKTVVCTAKHPCFPEVKVEIQTANIKTDPVVVIRRRFVKSTQTDSPVLECVVNGLPSGEVCINFQANQIDISVLSCVDWAPSENIWSLTKQFPIPREHQRNGKTFTCKVQRPFKSWTSKPTGNIFGDPTIQLAVVPSVGQSSSDQQKLLCSVTGFNPNIKWLSDSVVKPGRDLDLTMMEDGRVKVYSEISVPQQEWNQGITYTCEINNGLGERSAEKSTSICAAQSLCKPSIQMKKSHLRDIILENKVTVSCVVEAPDNTKVSLLTDSVRQTATTEYRDQFNNTVSNLTLSRNDWLTLKTVVCTAKHPCFPEVKVEIQTADIKTDPVVVIRRRFVKSTQTDSPVLECVVNGLPSGEVCINFQANQIDISVLSCVDWAPSENIWSLTKQFPIPKEHQRNGKTFTCKVQRPFKSWTSKPTGNIFGNATIQLAVVPSVGQSSSDQQKLLCSVTGFNPNIKWLSDSVVKPGRDLDLTMMEDGRVKVYSEISVPQQEWNQGITYTCEINNGLGARIAEKSTSICAAQSLSKPSIQMKKSHLRDIIQENKVTVTCVVEAPDNTKVSWLTDSARKTATTEYRDQFNNTVSNLTLFRNDWLTLKTVVCTAKHPCFPEVKVEIQTADIKTDPVVVIRRRFVKSTQTDSPVLECVVNGLPSGEVCINFQANQIDISVLSCVDWAPSENIWSLTKQFPIPREHQRNGKTFTCKVQRPFKSWTSKPTGNIFGNATIQLAVVPSVGQSSSDQQKLLCSVTGFNPNIKWLSDSVVKPGRDLDLTMMEDGRVKVYSEISVPQQEWNQGITYTCEINNGLGARIAEKSTSICAAQSLSKPSIQMKKSHLRDIIQENKVTVTCVVEAPDNTKVSWLTDSARKTATTEYRDQFNNTVSNLTLFRDDWLTLKTVVCTAKHPCFPEVKDEIQTADIKTDPVVVIRRRFVKSTQTDSPVLECVVNGLPSGEVCINFQANQIDISVLSCVDWAPSENIWSLTKQFPIPKEHQRNGKTFTCKVQRPFKSWTSKPTGNIFGDPTIQLAVVPSVGQSSSDQQKLLCSVTGFNPNIKWLSDSVVKPGRDLDLTMMEDGRVKVYSEISVPQQEWNQGITCQTKNNTTTAEKRASICTVIAPSSQRAEVYLVGPSLSSVRSDTSVTLTCLVVGQSVKLFSIQWKVNGKVPNPKGHEQEPRDHNNGTQSKESILKCSVRDWNAYALFTCEVKHLCSTYTHQKNISKTRDPKQPTVRILRPSDSDLSGLQNPSLLCLITGFFPSDISVQWKLNGTQLDASQFTNSPVAAHTSGGFTMHSALMLPASERKDGTFSCVVSHESSQNPISATVENLYASLIRSPPSVELLQGTSVPELVCLVFGFSPPDINITWWLGKTEMPARSISHPAKGPDGKFSIQSHLELQSSDWVPGEVYTCEVTHVTGILSPNISTKTELFEEAIFLNENKPEAITQDTVEEAWNMACAFLVLFLLSLLYGCTVTLVKVRLT